MGTDSGQLGRKGLSLLGSKKKQIAQESKDANDDGYKRASSGRLPSLEATGFHMQIGNLKLSVQRMRTSS